MDITVSLQIKIQFDGNKKVSVGKKNSENSAVLRLLPLSRLIQILLSPLLSLQ